jgi:hypothetical protein
MLHYRSQNTVRIPHTLAIMFSSYIAFVVNVFELYLATLKQHLNLNPTNVIHNIYSSAPVYAGNIFQDLPRLRETADNTERYI